jgi:hypothetical protein
MKIIAIANKKAVRFSIPFTLVLKTEAGRGIIYLRIGQKAGNFSIPFVLADKVNLELV